MAGPSSSKLVRASVSLLVVGGVVAFFALAVNTAKQARKRQGTANNFGQVWLGLRTYDAIHGHLPVPTTYSSQGAPLASWRLAIIEFTAAYGERDHPDVSQKWDSPVNCSWRCVAQPFAYDAWGEGVWDTNESLPQETIVLAITGDDTAFGGKAGKSPKSLKEVEFDAILAVEVRHSGIHWAEPGDFDVLSNSYGTFPSNHAHGFHVLFADGEVWFVSNDIPIAKLKLFMTLSSAARNDREDILAPFRLHRTLPPK